MEPIGKTPVQLNVQTIKAPQTYPRLPQTGRTSQRPPAWRPQPSSLSRDELRKIVLEMIG